tara:strand:- start:434 stop:607 length:174 start_codon:yes stop_codon:yes gene_type:complete
MLVNQFQEIEKTDLPVLNMNKDLLSDFTPFAHAAKLEEVLKGLLSFIILILTFKIFL